MAQPLVVAIEQTQLLAVRHDLAEQHRLEHHAGWIGKRDWNNVAHVHAHALPHFLLHETVAHAHGGLECELLAVLHLEVGHAVVDLFQAEHTERNVAGFVAHDIAQQLLEQWLLGGLVQEAKGCERKALNHDLHAQVGHVPAAVVDDVVEQHAQVSVHLVAATELLVEVTSEHFNVAGFVHHLGAGVQLGVVPRDGLDDLGGADQCTLLAVQELAELPVATLDTKLEPLFVAPLGHWSAIEDALVDTDAEHFLVLLHGLFDIDVEMPWEIGGAIPLASLGLLVELAQRWARERIIPGEDRVSIVLDNVQDLIGIGGGDGQDCVDVVDLGAAENRLVVVVHDGHCGTPDVFATTS